MILEIITDSSQDAKLLSLAVLEAVKAMPWPELSPGDRPPLAMIGNSEPTRPCVANDIWFSSSASIPAQTIQDRLYIHDGEKFVKQTSEFEPDLSL